MSKRITRHVRANVVGYVALFVTLGGTGAWAGDKITSKEIAKNAVRSKHIKKNAVKPPKIADGAVKVAKLAAGSVRTAKIADGAVTSGKIRDGNVRGGDIADQALQAGHLGPGVFSSGDIRLFGQGSTARWGIVPDSIGARQLMPLSRLTETVAVPANTAGDGQYRMRKVIAECPPNAQLISGDAAWSPRGDVDDELVIAELFVNIGQNRVEVLGGHDLNEDRTLVVGALCLPQ